MVNLTGNENYKISEVTLCANVHAPRAPFESFNIYLSIAASLHGRCPDRHRPSQ